MLVQGKSFHRGEVRRFGFETEVAYLAARQSVPGRGHWCESVLPGGQVRMLGIEVQQQTKELRRSNPLSQAHRGWEQGNTQVNIKREQNTRKP